jgi:hypothetical protein
LALLRFFHAIGDPSSQHDPRTTTEGVDGVSIPSVEEGLAPFLGHAEDQKCYDDNGNTKAFDVTNVRKGKGQKESHYAIKAEMSDFVAVGKVVDGCGNAGEVPGIGCPHEIEEEGKAEQGY